jgi:hypothetical protein
MCKHSKKSVDELAKRQRGLDARGNDTLATQRESSWATEFVKNPPGDAIKATLGYFNGFPQKMAFEPKGNTFKRKDGEGQTVRGIKAFNDGLTTLGNAPDGKALANFIAQPEFKYAVDELGYVLEQNYDQLHKKAREQSYFNGPGGQKDAGRGKHLHFRRNSVALTTNAGITTGADRTSDTEDFYDNPLGHAKAQNRADMASDTFKKFKNAGAPFIAGASGTMQYIALDMETRKPMKDLGKAELKAREQTLAMLSAQHVALGHHSMAECLIAVKPYGYFKDVPDPLTDYDAAMKAFEKHLEKLGLGGGKPSKKAGGNAKKPPSLSRGGGNEGKSKEQINYEDRLSFVRSLRGRYEDQLSDNELEAIDSLVDDAVDEAGKGHYTDGLRILAQADNRIRAQASLVEAKARGNNKVLRPEELAEAMAQGNQRAQTGGKARKKESAEYTAVNDALADYEKSMKQLAGRKLNHDQIEAGFAELTAALTTAKAKADAYKKSYPPAQGGADVMGDLIQKLDAEITLLADAERQFDVDRNGNLGTSPGSDPAMDVGTLGDLTIGQLLEFQRFGVKAATQIKKTGLKEDRIENKERLGSGGVNTVTLVDYKAEGQRQAEQRAFKPEPEKASRTGYRDHLQNDLGIDPDNPKFGKRNIASKKLADAIGLGDLIPDAQFATVDGQFGLSMQFVKGNSPIKKAPVGLPDNQLDGYPDLKKARDIKARGGSADEIKNAIPQLDGNGRPQSLGYDQTTQTFTNERLHKTKVPFEAPPAQPEQVAAMQEQLTNLQWLDAVSGQTDRHGENYVVNTEVDPPKIMGIDNDHAFGKKRKDPSQKLSQNLGFPPVVDKGTFDKLMQMVTNWDQIAASLGDELDADEIDATKERLDAVKTELEKLEKAGRVVKSWHPPEMVSDDASDNDTDEDNDKDDTANIITDILTANNNFDNYFNRDKEYQKGMPLAT